MRYLRGRIISSLCNITGLDRDGVDLLLEVPPDKSLGDIAFPCFGLARKFKNSPNNVANELKDKLKIPAGIKKVEVVGGYINFFFDEIFVARSILTEIWKHKEKFGFKRFNNKRLVVEFPAPNTNKPLHLGHLRNMCLGVSISRLFEAQGFRVFRVNLYNDRGVHICKSMLAYIKWGNNASPDKKSDYFVGDFYVLFSKRAKENPSLECEVQDLLRKWEAGDKDTVQLWKKMNRWALDGFKQTFRRFGLTFDREYFESDIYTKGKELVLGGLRKGVFAKDESGEVVADLGNLGKKVLLRKDGTSVYITQDLYLAKLKYKDFKYDQSIYIVCDEQDYHFNVLFKLLELLNFSFAKNCYHLSYGMVFLPTGRMKSREGTVVDADTLMNELSSLALKELESRNKISAVRLKKLADKIGLAAIRYHLLKSSSARSITFNPAESISFDGNTGPYIQYSLVRANKILKKSKLKPSVRVNFDFKESVEFDLIKKLSLFSEVIARSTESYSPHILAVYAYELASLFSNFYEKCPVIGETVDRNRLLLVKCFSVVMKSCLYLLGIDEVDVM